MEFLTALRYTLYIEVYVDFADVEMVTYHPHESDDPWLFRPDSRALQSPNPPKLQVDCIEGVEPLGVQFGEVEKKTVPEKLHDALFGQLAVTDSKIKPADTDPLVALPLRTYAIIDAGKVTNLPALLAGSQLEHRCLFRGDAFDELKEVAPWIVQLEEGHSFTRNLFTRSEASWHLWDNEVGFYIRSRRTLNEMWRHFRKFTRVQDESGRWLYWRFWESSALDWLSNDDSAMKICHAFLDEAQIFYMSRLGIDGQRMIGLRVKNGC